VFFLSFFCIGRLIFFLFSCFSPEYTSLSFSIGVFFYHIASQFYYGGFLLFIFYCGYSLTQSFGIPESKLKVAQIFMDILFYVSLFFQILLGAHRGIYSGHLSEIIIITRIQVIYDFIYSVYVSFYHVFNCELFLCYFFNLLFLQTENDER
jgi:hypothetical protein